MLTLLQLCLCFPFDPPKNWGQTNSWGEKPRRLPRHWEEPRIQSEEVWGQILLSLCLSVCVTWVRQLAWFCISGMGLGQKDECITAMNRM